MDLPRTRANRGRSASAARRALVGFACVLAACLCLAASTAASRAAAVEGPRSMTDAQLQAATAKLEAEAEDAGVRLMANDTRREQLRRERETTLRLLGEFLAESYKHGGSDGNVLVQVFGSGGVGEATDRLRVALAVGDHHASLVRSIDEAERDLDVDQVERARLIARLSQVQAHIVAIGEEQARREAMRIANEQARAEREQAAAAKRAEQAAAVASIPTTAAGAPGQLVASGGGAGAGSMGVAPLVPAGSAPSAAVLDAYLASKGSPMAGQGAAFMASGQRWQVDPRLLVAIAGAESSFGQVTCGPNNAWGWACPNDPADFATWAAGIDTVTRGLRQYYLDEGRTSVAMIQQKYCPVGAANDPTGLNSHWRENVTKFLLELGGNPAMVGPGPVGPIAFPDLGGLGLTGD